jgi:GDPmannose 4,6-dehydratase
MKRILITGITGQDGSYLARFLLKRGDTVHGIRRRTSANNTGRLEWLLGDDFSKITLHYGEMTDTVNLVRLVGDIQPDEIYHLAAQSHVHVSFEAPEYTGNTDALGTLRMLEAVRLAGLSEQTRFYQASTSELFGNSGTAFQSETTPFHPRSPYAVAKLYAWWVTVNYREAYNMFACNGILFNHESPLRDETFVTRKITRAVACMKYDDYPPIRIGNLDAKRDWGHAADYVEGIWLMLQQDRPDDYVLATGKSHSVREWIELAFAVIDIEVAWIGSGVSEKGIDRKTGRTLLVVDPRYFRPIEVDHLCGDASRARQKLKWRPTHTLEEIVQEMVLHDLDEQKRGMT